MFVYILWGTRHDLNDYEQLYCVLSSKEIAISWLNWYQNQYPVEKIEFHIKEQHVINHK